MLVAGRKQLGGGWAPALLPSRQDLRGTCHCWKLHVRLVGPLLSSGWSRLSCPEEQFVDPCVFPATIWFQDTGSWLLQRKPAKPPDLGGLLLTVSSLAPFSPFFSFPACEFLNEMKWERRLWVVVLTVLPFSFFAPTQRQARRRELLSLKSSGFSLQRWAPPKRRLRA